MRQIAATTGFKEYLIEKDYYLTLILSKIDELSTNLAFKGGTCLNKIYFDYHRLSEDLDFTMLLPKSGAGKKTRQSLMSRKSLKNF
ncbi:MAG: nucleotidyl transferase AbiEii/AbiGii toxin family protein [Endomicrobium sp.]|nr:nucleotidyl transferase AbiEii/AbiGii toxin family protein [Endomicrobium sp.]